VAREEPFDLVLQILSTRIRGSLCLIGGLLPRLQIIEFRLNPAVLSVRLSKNGVCTVDGRIGGRLYIRRIFVRLFHFGRCASN
jgi:hypothetical protein